LFINKKTMLVKNIKILAAVLLAVWFGSVASYSQNSASQMKLTKVVIDPGHGGNDGGAPGCDKITNEKDMVLKMAKALKQKINEECPDVQVILTRTTDVRIDLLERAEIANRNNADLFISLHNNANKSSTPKGFSAHILGESSNKNKDVFGNNLDVCKAENSVITLEDDYTVKYAGFDPDDPSSSIIFSLMQNAYYDQSVLLSSFLVKHMNQTGLFANRGISQDNLFVLWRTAMPSVLIECGFISNKTDLATLKNEQAQKEIINALFEAFKEYKANYEGTEYVPSPAETKQEKEPEVMVAAAEQTQTELASQKANEQPEKEKPAITYGLQVLVSGKLMSEKDSFFRGNKVTVLNCGKVYKYVIGESESPEEAKKFKSSVDKYFKDSFIVRIEDGVPSIYNK